jgi:chemotaxis family two-component system response regulator Rcp1
MSSEDVQPAKALSPGSLPAISPRAPLLVLHVDDSTDDQVLFQAACKQANAPFSWHVAESAERGLSYLKELLSLSEKQSVRWPDLVVLDVVMPGGSGLKVLEFIRATPKLSPLPVIIFTGHSSDAVREAAMRLGVNSFYDKPSDFAQLVQLVGALYKIWTSARRPEL